MISQPEYATSQARVPRPDQPADEPDEVVDHERFLRQAFAAEARRGCELLFRAYYQDLCSHAARFVYSRQVAEDLVGEVFLHFYTHQTHDYITTSFRAYLFRAVRNRALNHLKSEMGRSELVDFLDVPATDDEADRMLGLDELLAEIHQTVRALPPQAQRVFLLSRFEGKTHAEISDELHIHPKTVESHITRALNGLRQALRPDWLASMLVFIPIF